MLSVNPIKRDIIVNPAYLGMCEFIEQLPNNFDTLDDAVLLHEGRNVVKLFEVDGQQFVAKNFNRISHINRFVYGSLRCSKAMRSYYNAMRLRSMEVDTPEPVAAIDIYRGRRLTWSCYLSRYSDYSALEIDDCLLQKADVVRLLDALAEFIVELHDKGVEHNDLNISNVLYKNIDGKYTFQLIDINRMEFVRTMSKRRRERNMCRLSLNYTAYMYVMERYARCIKSRGESFELRCATSRMLFEYCQRFKAKMKDIF